MPGRPARLATRKPTRSISPPPASATATPIIAAYQSADPAVRLALDRTSDVLNAMVWRTRELVLQHIGTAEVETVARRALDRCGR